MFKIIVIAGRAQTRWFLKGRLHGDEDIFSDDWDCSVAVAIGSFRSRQFNQRGVGCAPRSRATPILQRRPAVADAFAGGFDTGPLSEPVDGAPARTTSLALLCQVVASAARSRRAHAQRISCACGRWRSAKNQRPIARLVDPAGNGLAPRGRLDGCHGLGSRLWWFQKKDTQSYSAHRARMGMRTFKTGQSRWYVGYKKHTLRLWWREHTSAVMLVPLVSWITPANAFEVACWFQACPIADSAGPGGPRSWWPT